MSKKIVLSLYRSKLRICHSYGYEFGDWIYINKNFNMNKVFNKVNKCNNISLKATYIANYTRFFYKDSKKIKNKKLIDYNIDEGFRILKYFNKYF